jgi:hypothetical protein
VDHPAAFDQIISFDPSLLPPSNLADWPVALPLQVTFCTTRT